MSEKVFVYGHFRRGLNWNKLLVNSTFIDNATTIKKYTLYTNSIAYVR